MPTVALYTVSPTSDSEPLPASMVCHWSCVSPGCPDAMSSTPLDCSRLSRTLVLVVVPWIRSAMPWTACSVLPLTATVPLLTSTAEPSWTTSLMAPVLATSASLLVAVTELAVSCRLVPLSSMPSVPAVTPAVVIATSSTVAAPLATCSAPPTPESLLTSARWLTESVPDTCSAGLPVPVASIVVADAPAEAAPTKLRSAAVAIPSA